jgi:hypothetical protein
MSLLPVVVGFDGSDGKRDPKIPEGEAAKVATSRLIGGGRLIRTADAARRLGTFLLVTVNGDQAPRDCSVESRRP